MTTIAAPAPAADQVGARAFAPAPSRPRPGVVLTESLSAARHGVSRAASVTGTGLSNQDLSTAAVELAALRSQVDALSMAVLAEAKDRGRAGPVADEGDVDPAAWWGKLTGDPTEVLRGGLWTAKLLQTRYHHTRRALEAGTLRLSQAKAIVRAAERAPKKLAADQVAAAEESLVLAATGQGSRSGRPMSAAALKAEARRTFTNLLPSKPEADQAEGDDVAAEEDAAERECYLSLNDRGDGTWRGTFVLPDLHGRLLQHALERLTAPRRRTRDPAGRAVEDESADVIGPSYGERLGAGFCEILEHLPTLGFAHGNAMQLLVKTTVDQLRAGLGAASLDTGVPVSARTARRLACNAGHIPLVLSGGSVPLELGRTRRLFTPAQAHALAGTYDACAVTGCRRPFAWCELHHLQPWSHGGPSDLANALPLCGHHHRRAHDPDYELQHHHGPEYRIRKRR